MFNLNRDSKICFQHIFLENAQRPKIFSRKNSQYVESEITSQRIYEKQVQKPIVPKFTTNSNTKVCFVIFSIYFIYVTRPTAEMNKQNKPKKCKKTNENGYKPIKALKKKKGLKLMKNEE